MNELYHHGVKGMKWGVRRKSSTSSKTSVKKSKNDNLTDEQLAAKKAKRKKALIIAGMAAATVAISAAGTYAVSSPKVRGLVSKGMKMFDKEKYDDFSGYEYPTDKHGNRIVDIDAYMREHKTGLYKED